MALMTPQVWPTLLLHFVIYHSIVSSFDFTGLYRQPSSLEILMRLHMIARGATTATYFVCSHHLAITSQSIARSFYLRLVQISLLLLLISVTRLHVFCCKSGGAT